MLLNLAKQVRYSLPISLASSFIQLLDVASALRLIAL